MTRSVPVLAAVLAAVLVAGCTSKEPDWSCPSGQERCDGQCVDPATYYVTAADCGGCGISCGAGTCSGGACACGGLTACPASNPRCSDLQTDPLNCGTCGKQCGLTLVNAVCVGGNCECGGLRPDPCGNVCTNTQTDARNCGTCGNTCPHAGEVCSAGACACPAALTLCTSTCVDTQTDPSSCGACGHRCATGATCSSGTCACPGGQSVCGTACADTSTDEANCGSCGHACPAGATCVSGSCPCPAGPIAGCQGACCAGGSSACCGNGACETQHSNGVGQSFFDCAPLGTYDQTQALEAARAWRSSGTLVPGSGISCGSMECVGWQTTTACGTWCYGQDAWQGRVTVNTANNVCLCPPDGSPRWN